MNCINQQISIPTVDESVSTLPVIYSSQVIMDVNVPFLGIILGVTLSQAFLDMSIAIQALTSSSATIASFALDTAARTQVITMSSGTVFTTPSDVHTTLTTPALLLAARGASELHEGTLYVFEGLSYGNLATTKIFLTAIDKDLLSPIVSIEVAYAGGQVWQGEYDLDADKVIKVEDRIGNEVRGNTGGEVEAFPWGNAQFTNWYVEDSTLNLNVGAGPGDLTMDQISVVKSYLDIPTVLGSFSHLQMVESAIACANASSFSVSDLEMITSLISLESLSPFSMRVSTMRSSTFVRGAEGTSVNINNYDMVLGDIYYDRGVNGFSLDGGILNNSALSVLFPVSGRIVGFEASAFFITTSDVTFNADATIAVEAVDVRATSYSAVGIMDSISLKNSNISSSDIFFNAGGDRYTYKLDKVEVHDTTMSMNHAGVDRMASFNIVSSELTGGTSIDGTNAGSMTISRCSLVDTIVELTSGSPGGSTSNSITGVSSQSSRITFANHGRSRLQYTRVMFSNINIRNRNSISGCTVSGNSVVEMTGANCTVRQCTVDHGFVLNSTGSGSNFNSSIFAGEGTLTVGNFDIEESHVSMNVVHTVGASYYQLAHIFGHLDILL